MNEILKKKKILITGGTGSFGNAIVRRLLDTDIDQIRIFSRDEQKQDQMRRKYKDDRLRFYIGDVRDPQAVLDVVRDVNYLFHSAALKQVPSCEFFPIEALKTNVLGAENVLGAAVACSVERVVLLSTDKAVYPVNAMGMSKALMEKVAIAKSRLANDTVVNVTRYGNVMGSRGSVIPLFIEQILTGCSVTITDPNMTRFMMTLEDAVDLVLFAFKNGRSGEVFVQKAPAATIATLVEALLDLFGESDQVLQTIGTRHGEKLYESLLSREEMVAAEDLDDYYRVSPDLRDLNYGKFFNQGESKVSGAIDYNSHNTTRLDVAGMKKLLMKLPLVQMALRGESMDPEN
jgi:UDP-N-acetylglucosamine 4,6-dehydratase